MNAGTPPGNWCLAHSRNRAPSEDSKPVEKIFHYLSDFNAFRDDAHMAAFMPHEAEGYIWEAFTLIDDGAADSAQSLFETIAYRGYAVEGFSSAIQTMATKGWVAYKDQTLATVSTTAEGKSVRKHVETLTDEYFYQPWRDLSDQDQKNLIDGLQNLKLGLENR